MTTAEALAGRAPRHGVAAQRGVAFGLEIEWDFPVPSLEGTAVPTGNERGVRLESCHAKEMKALWAGDRAETLFERRLADQRPALLVQRDGDGDYRVWAPGHGRYHISADGSRICAFVPGSGSGWQWQRLLVAQPLPLAAALQGLALVHASSVAVGGRAFAFLASSGTGKTSVAAHLVARGATHVTDDIVALESDG